MVSVSALGAHWEHAARFVELFDYSKSSGTKWTNDTESNTIDRGADWGEQEKKVVAFYRKSAKRSRDHIVNVAQIYSFGFVGEAAFTKQPIT